uniref:Uncharacterized protein n=1 Tax=Plectus sambesii TaxID=2011161 RepID=A0A914VQP5_9BILA
MSAFDYPRSSIDSKSSKGSSPTRTTDLSSASTLYYRK